MFRIPSRRVLFTSSLLAMAGCSWFADRPPLFSRSSDCRTKEATLTSMPPCNGNCTDTIVSGPYLPPGNMVQPGGMPTAPPIAPGNPLPNPPATTPDGSGNQQFQLDQTRMRSRPVSSVPITSSTPMTSGPITSTPLSPNPLLSNQMPNPGK